jgi:hypothetical protein
MAILGYPCRHNDYSHLNSRLEVHRDMAICYRLRGLRVDAHFAPLGDYVPGLDHNDVWVF